MKSASATVNVGPTESVTSVDRIDRSKKMFSQKICKFRLTNTTNTDLSEKN